MFSLIRFHTHRNRFDQIVNHPTDKFDDKNKTSKINLIIRETLRKH